MTTILYPGMQRPRNVEVTDQIARRFGPSREPDLPPVPRPLWERDRLFLEPDLPEQTDLEDDDEDA